jgi:hypothetical protein
MNFTTIRRAVALAASMTITLAHAADASQLGTMLSPAGADKAASSDGTVPAWTPAEPQGAGWTFGKRRIDYFKYKADEPLFSIDASNVDKYVDKLAPGQVTLVKSVKDFRMDVYPSRRTCGVPDFVAENTKKNVGFAKMAGDGTSLQEAHVPGFPFPLPSNGAEAMWNMKLHYRGLGAGLRNSETFVSPRKGSDEWIKAAYDLVLFTPWGAKGSTLFSKVDRLELAVYFSYNAPPALAGQAAVATNPAGQPQEVHYYFPGQRRVRRMPTYSYDSPQIGMDNQITVDESYVFSGPMDRFDWKLVGKAQLIVPYNSFGLLDFSAKAEQVLQRDAPSPASRRYEMHRVWVVEATVKQGVRHLAPKRTFYLDEDSWAALLAVDQDAQGKVWKVREGYAMPVYETGSCDVAAYAQYNLADQRYLVDYTTVGAGTDIQWFTEAAGNPRLKPDFYTADNLRAISER